VTVTWHHQSQTGDAKDSIYAFAGSGEFDLADYRGHGGYVSLPTDPDAEAEFEGYISGDFPLVSTYLSYNETTELWYASLKFQVPYRLSVRYHAWLLTA